MALETASYIASLVTSNPDGTDQRSTADDHLRLIKACLKRTLPMIDGAISASAAAVTFTNDLSGFVQAQLNTLRDGAATANFAVQAHSASFANLAGNALSASFARSASFAHSASFAQYAGHAASASYAISAVHALSASFATLATDSNKLGTVTAGTYARKDTPQSWSAGQGITQVNSSGTTLTPDVDASTMFRHQMTASVALTINAPLNARSGTVITLHLVNGSGSTAVWNSIYKFAGGVTPTLSTASSVVDVFAFQYDSHDGQWRQAGIGVT